jgi:hypothetical protein
VAKERSCGPKARITVKVQPQSKLTGLAGRMQNAYRLRLAAPPVDGKANEECIAFFADLVKAPKSRVRIVAGLTSRTKVVEIDGIAQQDLESRLNA